jgi:hypothetical protein
MVDVGTLVVLTVDDVETLDVTLVTIVVLS